MLNLKLKLEQLYNKILLISCRADVRTSHSMQHINTSVRTKWICYQSNLECNYQIYQIYFDNILGPVHIYSSVFTLKHLFRSQNGTKFIHFYSEIGVKSYYTKKLYSFRNVEKCVSRHAVNRTVSLNILGLWNADEQVVRVQNNIFFGG